jgi:hypothetical protein
VLKVYVTYLIKSKRTENKDQQNKATSPDITQANEKDKLTTDDNLKKKKHQKTQGTRHT